MLYRPTSGFSCVDRFKEICQKWCEQFALETRPIKQLTNHMMTPVSSTIFQKTLSNRPMNQPHGDSYIPFKTFLVGILWANSHRGLFYYLLSGLLLNLTAGVTGVTIPDVEVKVTFTVSVVRLVGDRAEIYTFIQRTE